MWIIRRGYFAFDRPKDCESTFCICARKTEKTKQKEEGSTKRCAYASKEVIATTKP
jgi:hypothetical protein